jgi:hypothetical protein
VAPFIFERAEEGQGGGPDAALEMRKGPMRALPDNVDGHVA